MAVSHKTVQEKQEENATEQTMTQAIMQTVIKATKVAIMAVREADNPFSNAGPIHEAPRSVGLALRQPMFDCKVANMYQELCNF